MSGSAQRRAERVHLRGPEHLPGHPGLRHHEFAVDVRRLEPLRVLDVLFVEQVEGADAQPCPRQPEQVLIAGRRGEPGDAGRARRLAGVGPPARNGWPCCPTSGAWSRPCRSVSRSGRRARVKCDRLFRPRY